MSKAKSKDTGSEKESASYQTMLEEVEGIVRSVSGGPLDLDEVVTRVERGYKLIKVMRERLDATKAKVEKLRTDFETDAVVQPQESKSRKDDIASKSEEDDEEDTPF